MDDYAIRDAVETDLELVDSFLKPFVEDELLLPRTREELALLLRHAFIAISNESANRESANRETAIERVVGFTAVEIYSKKLAEIQCLAVLPDLQGKGVGRQLVLQCIERARRENVLELMAISASDAFLQRCGFDYSLPNQKKALFYRPSSD